MRAAVRVTRQRTRARYLQKDVYQLSSLAAFTYISWLVVDRSDLRNAFPRWHHHDQTSTWRRTISGIDLVGAQYFSACSIEKLGMGLRTRFSRNSNSILCLAHISWPRPQISRDRLQKSCYTIGLRRFWSGIGSYIVKMWATDILTLKLASLTEQVYRWFNTQAYLSQIELLINPYSFLPHNPIKCIIS